MNFDRLSQYVRALHEEQGIPAVDVKITRGHETVFRESVGYKDRDKSQPTGDQDLYLMYSVTKVVTTVAALQLWERGELRLDEDLSRYFPEYSVMRVANEFQRDPVEWPRRDAPATLAKQSIRIIDLMTMTAGLSYDMGSIEAGPEATTQDMIRALADLPLCYEPRTRYLYGLDIDVLGGVVERVSGMRLGEYFKQHIFGPLEVEDVYFALPESAKARLQTLYLGDQAGTKFEATEESFLSRNMSGDIESGGGGLVATVDALSAFVEALSNGGVGRTGARILGERAMRLLSTPYTTGQLQEDFQRMNKPGYAYGLGVRVLTDQSGSRSPVGEFGWDGAAGAFALVDPFNKISIFYAQHILGYSDVYTKVHPKIRDLAYEAMGL